MEDMRRLTGHMMITLLFLFMIFVILDVATTQWLIDNSPGGIVNEINPIGVMLYTRFGSAAMIFSKVGMFSLFAAMAVHFAMKYSHLKWFVEVSQTLVLIQIAVSLVVVFNNFVAVLATLYVKGSWPILPISRSLAVALIYAADVGLGATFANGIMYMWGLTRRMLHLKVFVGLLVFITPVLIFAEGFRVHLWLFAVYVASASSALGIAFYVTEASKVEKERASAGIMSR